MPTTAAPTMMDVYGEHGELQDQFTFSSRTYVSTHEGGWAVANFHGFEHILLLLSFFPRLLGRIGFVCAWVCMLDSDGTFHAMIANHATKEVYHVDPMHEHDSVRAASSPAAMVLPCSPAFDQIRVMYLAHFFLNVVDPGGLSCG